MSIALELKDDLSNLPLLIQRYDDEIQEGKVNLDLKGKGLEIANREQPSWYCHYYFLLQEVRALQNVMEVHVEKTKGKLWKELKENTSLALSSTDLTQYVNNESKYVLARKYLAMVEETVGTMTALVKAFEQRGFTLRNLTEMRIHEIRNAVID